MQLAYLLARACPGVRARREGGSFLPAKSI